MICLRSAPLVPRQSALRVALLASLLVLAVIAGCGNATRRLRVRPRPRSPGARCRPPPRAPLGARRRRRAVSPPGDGGRRAARPPLPSCGRAAGAGDWPTYQHDAARSGVSSDQGALGRRRARPGRRSRLDARRLRPAARRRGKGVRGERGEHRLRARRLDRRQSPGSGTWESRCPASDLPCGNIDPSGITGTPVIDAAAATLYVVANLRSGPHHELFALDLSDGTVRWHRAIDPPGLAPAVEQERGALALERRAGLRAVRRAVR